MFSSKVVSCICYRHKNVKFIQTNFNELIRNKYNVFKIITQSHKYSTETNITSKIVETDLDATQKSFLPYRTINDTINPQIVRLFTNTRTRNSRYKKGLIMLEGKRLIIDALKNGVEPKIIVFSRRKLIEDLPLKNEYITKEKTILYKLSYKQIQLWSNLTTSPGITGVFKMPNLMDNVSRSPTYPITFVCDNVREPGNLGSILRIAAAVPVEKVIILSGCVDIWDTKVSRSSCGALFQTKILNNINWEEVNELCSGNVVMADHMSSLNDGIDSDVIPIENISPDEINKLEEEVNVEETLSADFRKIYHMPTIMYHDIDYPRHSPIVLIIGGETEGLSEEAFQFAQSKKGVRANIPMADGVNSLNVATALGIITFEMKKQFSNH